MKMTELNEQEQQYSLAKILGIWALGALPMGILGWIIAPGLAAIKDPFTAGVIRIWMLTLGLIWQFVLAMIILYREHGNLRWSTIRERLWLQTPQDPKTGEPKKRLWLWLIPGCLLFALFSFVLGPVLTSFWTSIFPFFAEPEGFAFATILESPEYRVLTVGNWGFFALIFLMSVFNTVLGEEFLFRGVLLPKMKGVFGKWDWFANGILFGFYHLHKPQIIIIAALTTGFLFAFPSQKFKSTWMGVIIHGVEGVFIFIMVLAVILGYSR